MLNISTSAAAANAAYFAAVANAERRALSSYFDQHVIADEDYTLSLHDALPI